MKDLIIKLNELLRKEELRAKDCYSKLKDNADELLRTNQISSYETNLELQLYTKNKNVNGKYGVEEGDPYYQSICITVGMFEDEEFFNMDWSEGGLDIPICYSMHDLLYHSHMERKDLESIDYVYYDLTFIYQFCIDNSDKINDKQK